MQSERGGPLPARLLIVDDDPLQRLVIGRIASTVGLQADDTASVAEAARRARSEAYRTILIDLSLGDGDAIGLLRSLAEMERAPQVLIVSGQDERTRDSVVRFARAIGLPALGEMKKPVDITRLKELLTQRVSHRFAAAPARPISREDLEAAIGSGAIGPRYQPQVDLETGHLVSAEALVRWRGVDLGGLAIIEAIEREGLALVLTEAMLRQACRDAADWMSVQRKVTVSVNVFASVAAERGFPDLVMRVLEETGLPARNLKLEIAEPSAETRRIDLLEVLTRLRIRSVRLALDDFGTGSSTLSSLLVMPYHELKIDNVFVSCCDRDKHALQIVRASIALARELGVGCVAEGVERQETRKLLLEAGCRQGQGHLFSQPVDAWEIRRMLTHPPASAAA